MLEISRKKKKSKLPVVSKTPKVQAECTGWLLLPDNYSRDRLAELKLESPNFEHLFTLDKVTSDKDTEQKPASSFKIREEAYKIVQKLINIDPVLPHDEGMIKPFNFIIKSYSQQKPAFFIEIIRQLFAMSEVNNSITILFKLNCLTDGELPAVHKLILKEIFDENNLELLFYYLINQQAQVKQVIESGLLIRLIIKSPESVKELLLLGENSLAKRANFDHLFKMFSYFSPELCQLVHDNMISKIPDFPWPTQYKKMLDLIGIFLKNLDHINHNCFEKLQLLLDKTPLLNTLEWKNGFLINFFYQATHQSNRQPLDDYLLRISQLPTTIAPVAVLHVLNALVDMSIAWSPCSMVGRAQTEFKMLSISQNLLQLFIKNYAFLRGTVFTSSDNPIIKKILEAIIHLNFKKMSQVFQDEQGLNYPYLTRKQFDTILLVQSMLRMTRKLLNDNTIESSIILKRIGEELDTLQQSLELNLKRWEAKLFAFEDSEQYRQYQSNFYEVSVTTHQEFKSLFFTCLHSSNLDDFYSFFDDLSDENQKISLLKFTNALCQSPEASQFKEEIFKEIQTYCIEKLEDIAYQSSVEVILNQAEIFPLLAVLGLSADSLNRFYQVYLDKNFFANKQEINLFFSSILKTNNAFITSYFIEVMDFYVNSSLKKSEDERFLIQSILCELRKNEKIIKENKSPSPQLVAKHRRVSSNKEAKQKLTGLDSKTGGERMPASLVQNRNVTNQSGRVLTQSLEEKTSSMPGTHEIKWVRACRKKQLYSLYLELFDSVSKQVNESEQSQEVERLDKVNYANVHTNIYKMLITLVEQQNSILSTCNEPIYHSMVFQYKEETLKLQSILSMQSHPVSIASLFNQHNQIVAALLREILSHKHNMNFLSDQEREIINHVDALLAVSFSGMPLLHQKVLLWLKGLASIIEEQALKDNLFHNYQRGFLKAGVYGSFIVTYFQSSLLDPLTREESPKESQEPQTTRVPVEDIDTVFYIDPRCTQEKSLSLNQLKKLEHLISAMLNPEVRVKGRFSLTGGKGRATWHGFKFEGKECDLTLQADPPIPVITHCGLIWCLDDNRVKFLKDCEHALLHITSNRLNIIAKDEQLLEPVIMAHVVKKVLGYLQKGINLTRHSKIVLGNLLLNVDNALPTICRFISMYAHRNPELYSKQFTDIFLPLIIDKKEQNISLKDYLVKHCLTVYDHLDATMVLREFGVNDFKLFFEKPPCPELLKDALYQFIHMKIAQYEKKQREVRSQLSFYPVNLPALSVDDRKIEYCFNGF